MSIAQLLKERLPLRFHRKSDGSLDVYALAKHLGIKPQTVYEWCRKDRVALATVNVLMKIDGQSFTLGDFRPYCADLAIVLDLQGGDGSEN